MGLEVLAIVLGFLTFPGYLAAAGYASSSPSTRHGAATFSAERHPEFHEEEDEELRPLTEILKPDPQASALALAVQPIPKPAARKGPQHAGPCGDGAEDEARPPIGAEAGGRP